jgi:hypothetical protein
VYYNFDGNDSVTEDFPDLGKENNNHRDLVIGVEFQHAREKGLKIIEADRDSYIVRRSYSKRTFTVYGPANVNDGACYGRPRICTCEANEYAQLIKRLLNQARGNDAKNDT